jgi:hypothetical protein
MIAHLKLATIDFKQHAERHSNGRGSVFVE